MRMRERSSVERMRTALTEKRDILDGIIAVEQGLKKRGFRGQIFPAAEDYGRGLVALIEYCIFW